MPPFLSEEEIGEAEAEPEPADGGLPAALDLAVPGKPEENLLGLLSPLE